jgi:hypothetical protein
MTVQKSGPCGVQTAKPDAEIPNDVDTEMVINKVINGNKLDITKSWLN